MNKTLIAIIAVLVLFLWGLMGVLLYRNFQKNQVANTRVPQQESVAEPTTPPAGQAETFELQEGQEPVQRPRRHTIAISQGEVSQTDITVGVNDFVVFQNMTDERLILAGESGSDETLSVRSSSRLQKQFAEPGTYVFRLNAPSEEITITVQ